MYVTKVMKIEHEYVTLEEVYAAYYDCRKHKSSTHGYIEYSLNYISNNYQLYAELNSGAYRIGKAKPSASHARSCERCSALLSATA